METIRETQKKYCSTAITVAIFAGLLFIANDQSAVGKGLILGTVFSILNFILMGEMIPRKLGKSKGRTFGLSLGSIFFRYFLMAMPIIAAVKLDQFHLISVIAGIFMVQVTILADHAIQIAFKIESNFVTHHGDD
ncbi:ATP synthase subunit I [Thermodesulfobacteriota bacterium]